MEETLAAELLMSPDVDVSIVPYLYDMPADHSGVLFLRSIPGDLVVLAWMFPRAARWTLDRLNVKGKLGSSLLDRVAPQDDDDLDDAEGEPEPPKETLGALNVPDRRIYCLDLRDHADPKTYLDEIKRIAAESAVRIVDLMSWIKGNPDAEKLERYLNPISIGSIGRADSNGSSDATAAPDSLTRRRWYPVIDYDRCTNCMECVDFCLFGVYGVDDYARILVEQQDNCKKGCPACSRVCPENAILFPEYKSPAIAGAPVASSGGLKIDLSALFGGDGNSALDMAVAERDRELVADGRDAVGATVGLPKRQSALASKPKDDLDQLLDGLGDF
jgi:hypothetical protein